MVNLIKLFEFLSGNTQLVVEAKDYRDACRKIILRSKEIKILGNRLDWEVFWGNKDKVIIQLPHCSMMYKICDILMCRHMLKNKNDGCGLCFLEGSVQPENSCPIILFEKGFSCKIPSQHIKKIWGIPYLQSHQISQN